MTVPIYSGQYLSMEHCLQQLEVFQGNFFEGFTSPKISIHQNYFQSVNQSIYLSIHSSIHLYIYPSINQPINQYIYTNISIKSTYQFINGCSYYQYFYLDKLLEVIYIYIYQSVMFQTIICAKIFL